MRYSFFLLIVGGETMVVNGRYSVGLFHDHGFLNAIFALPVVLPRYGLKA
jgi:hypothetical protein